MIEMAETAIRTSAPKNGRRPAAQVLVEAIRVIYPAENGGEPVHALQGIDLEVAEGEFVSLIGPSGCGISALLVTAFQFGQKSATTYISRKEKGIKRVPDMPSQQGRT